MLNRSWAPAFAGVTASNDMKANYLLASIESQIRLAMSAPPNFFTSRMPVGEVTLISVR